MKRTYCHYCRTCRLSFEDTKRYNIHVTSRRHVIEELLSDNTARETLLVQDENEEPLFVFMDEGEDDEFNEYFTQDKMEGHPTENHQLGNTKEQFFSPDEVERQLSQELINDESENSEEFGDGNKSDDDSADFYPFPSKIFFLLYCYVHNICRPKVQIVIVFEL